MRPDRSGVLKTTPFQTPDGQSITLPTLITGISNGATHFTLGDGSLPTLVSGRGFRDSDANANVAMMNQTLATMNKLVVGSTFKLQGVTFTLIGLYTTTSQFIDNTLIVPIKTVQRMFAVDGVDTITAYAASYEQVEPLATKLRAALGSKYDVVTNDALYTSTFHALDVATNSIQLTFIVSIITATAVIIFAVFILVRERAVEIGTLKAIGASHWQVIRQFWSELFALSGLAALLAAILLATVGPLISQAFDVATPSTANAVTSGRASVAAPPANIGDVHLAAATLNAQTFLIIVGLGMALTILTSVIPAWYVAHIKPAVVLRSGN
jgi:ABC-type antimicrobial peptide transport system permease subunit